MAIDQVTTGLIKDDAVTTAKIVNDAVTAAKIPAGAVVADIANDSVTAAHLANGAIDHADKIASGVVTNVKLGADAVDGTKLADNAVNSEHVTAGAIDTAHVGDDQITGAKIENNPTIAGKLTVAGDFVPSKPLSNRNTLINGNFDIWQRGVSFAAIGSWEYVADRWAYGDNSEAVHTITRSSDKPTQAQSGITSLWSLKIDVTTVDSSVDAGHYSFLYQKLEGYHMRGLFGNPVTLSFWVKSNKTGIYTVCWRNSNLNMNMVKEYTISAANTWEKKVITWTFDNSGGTWGNFANDLGGWMCWNFAHGTNFNTTKDVWQSTSAVMNTAASVNFNDSTSNEMLLSQVQLEVGSSATPFEHESFAEVLRKCQRYCYSVLYPYGYPGGIASTPAYVGNCWAWNGTTIVSSIPFPVTMRTNAWTIEQQGTGSGLYIGYVAGAGHVWDSMSINTKTANFGTLTQGQSVTLTSGTAGGLYLVGDSSKNGYIRFVTEL